MSVKKNYFYNVILSGTNLLFPLLTFPYVSRILEPAGIGRAQFAFTFAQYFSIIAAIGIPFYGIKEIAKHRNDKDSLNKTFSELIILSFWASLIALAIYLASVFMIPEFGQNLDLYLISGLVVLFSFLNLDWLFSGLEDFRLITIRSVIIKSLALLILFLFVSDKGDVRAYVWVLTTALSGNYLLNLFYLKKKVRFLHKGLNYKKHLGPLLFILSSTFATTVYSTLDSVTLGLISNEFEVGLYTAAVKISKIAIPVVTGMSAVLIPRIANAIGKGDKKEEFTILNKSFSFILFLSIPASFGLFLFRDEFILLFSGVDFLPAAESLKYLAFLPFFIGLGYFFGFQVLVPNGLNRGLFLSTIIGLFIFLGLNLLLTPERGAEGTAIAILCTEGLVTILYIAFTPNSIVTKLPWTEIAYCVLISILFYPIKSILNMLNLSTELSLVIGIFTCSLVYFLSQYYIFSNQFVKLGWNLIRKNKTPN